MMKKLTKAALLAAATVFMLAACSHSSGGGGEKEENPSKEPNGSEENSVSYDFADLTEADLTTLGVTFTDGKDVKIATANAVSTPYMVLNGEVGIVTTAASKLSVRPKDGVPLAIGFNTNGLNRDVNDTTEVGQTVTLAHFITYPVVSGKKYKMAITSGGQENQEAHYFVVTDTSGKILASKACSTSKTDAVTLDAFEVKEEVIRLSVHRSNNGGTSYIGKVTLTEITTEVKVTDIKVSAPAGSEKKVTVKKTLQLTATVAPEEATSKSVKWESSDDTIATVSASGLVTGVAAGEVTITATATDGSGVKDEITLTVVADSEQTPPESNQPPSNDPNDKGEDENPGDTATPKNWTVTVSNKSGVIEPVNTGLTIAYDDGSGGTESANADDFKFGNSSSKLTLTMSSLKAGQSISITPTVYSGSAQKTTDDNIDYYKPVDIQVTSSTNVTDNESPKILANGSSADVPTTALRGSHDANGNIGTAEDGAKKPGVELAPFKFTVNADGNVVIVLQRKTGNTPRLTKLVIDVK